MKPFDLAYIDSGAFGTVVTRPWVYRPKQLFPGANDFVHPLGWYEQRVIDPALGVVEWIAHIGCSWDYASCYFDGTYIRVPSLGHDIGCHLLGVGAIPKKYNDRVDHVFYDLLRDESGLPKWRAKILEHATHLHNAGDKPQTYLQVKYIYKGKHIKP